jgi:uncharacterized protein (DUF305 family)
MYKKFIIMLSMSFVVMYAVMFLNVFSFDHVYLSATRFYMTLLMVTPMAIIMLLMMKKMYPNKAYNSIIIASSVGIFILSLWFLRSQVFIKDEMYMKAMIPHHSSAILTSKNAEISDPEVRKLADDIIKAQQKEIAEMKALLEKIDKK